MQPQAPPQPASFSQPLTLYAKDGTVINTAIQVLDYKHAFAIPSTQFAALPSSPYPFTVFDPYFYQTACAVSSISHSTNAARSTTADLAFLRSGGLAPRTATMLVTTYEGKLYYRGYDMEELVDSGASFLQVAYLLIYGAMPSAAQKDEWETIVMNHTYLHTDILDQLRTFRYDAHPMGILISSMAALSTFYPEANPSLHGSNLYMVSEAARNKQVARILGKMSTVAACAYRVRIGRHFNLPDSSGKKGYTENLFMMLDRLSENEYAPNPKLCRLLDMLFIALADDGMNCATGLLRHVTTSRVDPYMCIAAAASAQYGARISGVSDAVLNQLVAIGSPENVSAFIDRCKRNGTHIQGFGHLKYKCYDPRAKVLKKIAIQTMDLFREKEPLMDVAMELENQIVRDPYFIQRRLYPNVDLYLPLIVKMMGFPPDFLPVLVSIARTAGWLAHWVEGVTEPGNRIARPRQLYCGYGPRPFVERSQRVENQGSPSESSKTSMSNIAQAEALFQLTGELRNHQKRRQLTRNDSRANLLNNRSVSVDGANS